MLTDDLLAHTIDRAGEIISSQQRLQRLMSANRAIVSQLSLPEVLRTIVDAAADLARGRYVALQVIAPDGSLEHFVHTGMDRDTVLAIGEPPRNVGLLGAVVEDGTPIRLAVISNDKRSAGVPPGHPPMGDFLGVPIRSKDEVFGNLCVSGRVGGEFTSEDEDLVSALAATAGIAIENARLYELARRRLLWLEASAEISGVLLAQEDDSDPLQIIVDIVKRLADADVVTLIVPADEVGMLRVAAVTGLGEAKLRGLLYSCTDTLVALAMATGHGVRVGALDEHEGYSVHLSQAMDAGAVLTVPLSGKSGPQGAIMAGRRKGRLNFSAADLEMTEAFADHAAVARELVEARADQQRLAVLVDRDRIARDLHDHVIQRLFASGLSLQGMAMRSDGDVGAKLSHIVEDINDTIRHLRTSIFQLHSTESSTSGLRSVVLTVVRQVTPSLGFEPRVRFDGPVDTVVQGPLLGDIEAVVRETLTNVVKHAMASSVTVRVSVLGGLLSVVVTDNGVGLGEPKNRSGLDNLRRRAEDLDGTLTIDTSSTEGTRLQWTIPTPA